METEQPKSLDSLSSPRKTSSIQSQSPSDQIDVDNTERRRPTWSTQTPQKLPHPPRPSYSGRITKLPDEDETLLRLFTGLDSAIRLLRMRKSVPVFSSVRPVVESITGRRFSHGHLAQMKYLFQEEIAIRKVTSLDDGTGCMKHDLLVSLNRDAIRKNGKRKQGIDDDDFSLKKLFRARLLEFLQGNPEGTEIPEEILPVTFSKPREDHILHANVATGALSHAKLSTSDRVAEMKQAMASHFSQTFKRHFSQKMSDRRHKDTPCYQASNSCLGYSSLTVLESSNGSPVENMPPSRAPVLNSSTEGSSAAEITEKAMNLPSATEPLKTPTLLPSRKTCASMTGDDSTKKAENLVARPSCARSLQFDSMVENANVELEVVDTESKDVLDVLPQGLLKSLKEKEKTIEQQRLRRGMITTLPKLFDRIHYLFHSIKYSAIRKEALIHKLTTCHGDIVDESEVVEQLKLLQEVLPEWISQKLSPSRNILLSIDKTLDPSMLRAKVNQAT